MRPIYPEDRVLIGVINRKRDFLAARDQNWYRIPPARAPRNLDARYLAFYFSRAFQERNGGIHYFARLNGHELVRRRDLLPDEADHARADRLYYKMQIGPIQERRPPILSPTRRPVSFIFTTWDRFSAAQTLADLYSEADWFVERVASVLKSVGIAPDKYWEAEDSDAKAASLRIRCEKGLLTASTGSLEGALHLQPGEGEDAVRSAAEAIRQAVQHLGGPQFIDIPLED